MEKSSKQIWVARFLALLLISIGSAILFTLVQIKYANYNSHINVWTNNKEEVVSAIENLGYSDIEIQTKDTANFSQKPTLIKSVIYVFVGFGFCLGIYHAIYCMVNAILFNPKKDETLLV